MSLSKKYNYLLSEPGPNMLLEALKLHGKKEMPGNKDNPEILAWAKEVGVQRIYSADSIPWCGLFIAVVAQRAKKAFPKDPLWALNWSKFGIPSPQASLGDVLVYKRNGGGHVNIYVGEDKDTFYGIGGNQADSVNVTRILKSRCVAIRRPNYKNTPANVRPIFLNAEGPISENEA